ncbi:MAG: hypothetical protein JXA46_15810 [Dehalococcoidales bacterium]|nr:hypothetical protein [Dehalococcoidales bacterium]
MKKDRIIRITISVAIAIGLIILYTSYDTHNQSAESPTKNQYNTNTQYAASPTTKVQSTTATVATPENPFLKVQSLTDLVSTQLVTRISNATSANLNAIQPAPILVVWSDTGKLCTGIQELIPSSYWPKTVADINDAYLVSITKTTGESARYGSTTSSITGYQVVYAASIIFNNQSIKKTSFPGPKLPDSIRVEKYRTTVWYGDPPSNSVIADWIKNTLCTQPR